MNARSKNWCFTCLNIDYEPLREYRNSYNYLVYGRETCPDTGRPHLQGFVSFRIRAKFSTVCQRLPGAHIEKNATRVISVYFKEIKHIQRMSYSNKTNHMTR